MKFQNVLIGYFFWQLSVRKYCLEGWKCGFWSGRFPTRISLIVIQEQRDQKMTNSCSHMSFIGTISFWLDWLIDKILIFCFVFIMWRKYLRHFWVVCQRYTYRVLQTIQMKLILLYVWAEPAVLGSTRTALKVKYEI